MRACGETGLSAVSPPATLNGIYSQRSAQDEQILDNDSGEMRLNTRRSVPQALRKRYESLHH
jgi:hypothetical protein